MRYSSICKLIKANERNKEGLTNNDYFIAKSIQ